MPGILSTDGIIPSGMKRMAAAEPPKSEPKSAKRPVLFNSGKGITGTAGIKTAGRSLEGGNEPLIDPDEKNN
jgi:hypothetical protein